MHTEDILEKLIEIEKELRRKTEHWLGNCPDYANGYDSGQESAADRVAELIEEIKSYFVSIED